MIRSYRTIASFLAFFALPFFLTGCFFGPSIPTAAEQAEKVNQLITNGGYSASHSYQIDLLKETWQHDGQGIEISMLAPKNPGIYPLIIYLPGLGESASAGNLWREIWAKSGYTVFTVQPVEISLALKELTPMLGKPDDDEKSDDEEKSTDGDKSRPSKAVRNSELYYMGHEYFSQASLKKRIDHLLWAHAQFKSRANTGSVLFKMADLSRVIIAGYDIGAQTAEEMIGEKFDIALPEAQNFKPMAAILLSPSVDMAQGNLTSRYKNISIPLLGVTGTEDDDPYGISSPFVRTAIWEYSPPGNKYLLQLNKGSHQLLAGSNLAHRQEASSDLESSEKTGSDNSIQRFDIGNSYRGGGRKGGGSPGGYSGGMGRSAHGGRQHYEQDFKHIAAVFSISTAFLDTVCKTDKFAQAWISDKANLWLKKSGELKIK
jgi:hypothetical protein